MISYCEDCGEYLGDYVDGKLYKFGKLVTEEHRCPGLEEEPTREEVKRYMAERKAGRADSKPFIGKWTGNYGRDIDLT
ncbi:hypothetical protein ES703_05394 [subsurface metagenome]